VRKFVQERPWLLWPAILAAALAAYWPALRGGFVWDDTSHVTAAALRSWSGLGRIWFDLGATQQYYPLLHSAFWIEHRLWGDGVLGYHLVNVFLHAGAACLVVLIVRRLALPGAWLAGLVFALHPVCVEAVAWISEQKSTLSAVFYLSAALVYLRFDESRQRKHYLWALGLFILALLSKTVTATLPAALLVVFWWKRGRLDLRRDVRPLGPWFALGITAGLFTAWVERKYVGAQGADFALTAAQRLLLCGRIICFYAGKLIWPRNLIFSYPRWTVDPTVWWQWLFPLGVAALAVSLIWLARRRRGPLAGFLFFAGTLFPVLGFFNVYPFVFSYVADHFQYLACLGIIVPVCSLANRIPRAAIPAAVVLLGVLTFRQSAAYRDTETLYRVTLARNPQSWMAHNNLGVFLSEKRGRLADAIGEYHASLRLNPKNAEAHNNLGSALAKMPGRLPEALAEVETAIRIKPGLSVAHNNRGVILAKMGRLDEAFASDQIALLLDPRNAHAHVSLADTLSKMPGRLPDAIAEYRLALQIQPDNAEAHNDLGALLGRMPGRVQEALAEFDAAVRIQPDYADAHNNRGNALGQMPGRLSEAVTEYLTALRLNPDMADAHDNLGSAWSRTPGRGADAIAEFQAAVRIKPAFAEAHNNLGIVLTQEAGRLTEAIAEFQAAVRAQPGYVPAHINLGNTLARMPDRLSDAIAEYQAALRYEPDNPEAHNNLGIAWSQMPGRLADAVAECQAAVRIQPDRAEAHNNLGNAYSKMPGRQNHAIAEFQAALRLQPDYLQAHKNLADALARIPGRGTEAIAEYEAVLRARPDLESVRQTIGRLQAAQR
jgi:tetratricopeptide (TPR) repeat protein